MTSLAPTPCEVSRRKVYTKLAISLETAIEYAVKHNATNNEKRKCHQRLMMPCVALVHGLEMGRR